MKNDEHTFLGRSKEKEISKDILDLLREIMNNINRPNYIYSSLDIRIINKLRNERIL